MRHPTPIVIPCHRVAGDGSLTGYRGGLQRKRALLDFEAARPDIMDPPGSAFAAVIDSSNSLPVGADRGLLCSLASVARPRNRTRRSRHG